MESTMFPDAQLALIALFASGTIVLIYGDIASERGWAVGGMMRGPDAPLGVVALISIIGAIALSFVIGPWYRFALTIGSGLVVSSITIPMLRSLVQPVALIGILASWIWVVLALGVLR